MERASSNVTPCFLKFEAAFAGSHVNRVVIAAKHTTHPRSGILDALVGGQEAVELAFGTGPVLLRCPAHLEHGADFVANKFGRQA